MGRPAPRASGLSRTFSRTARIGFGRTPSGSASAVPRAEISGTSSSSASSQVANAVGPPNSSTKPSSRRVTAAGTPTIRRRRRNERSAIATISRCVSVSGPASS